MQDSSTQEKDPEDRRQSHSSDEGPPESRMPDTAKNRLHDRRPPDEYSRSGLVSQDYQPRHGGPELVASWPLGIPPGSPGPGVMTGASRARSSSSYSGISPSITFWPDRVHEALRRRQRPWSRRGRGDAYDPPRTRPPRRGRVPDVHRPLKRGRRPVHDSDGGVHARRVRLPRVRVLVHRPRDVGGYVLSAKVSGGMDYLDQRTSVSLWSE